MRERTNEQFEGLFPVDGVLELRVHGMFMPMLSQWVV